MKSLLKNIFIENFIVHETRHWNSQKRNFLTKRKFFSREETWAKNLHLWSNIIGQLIVGVLGFWGFDFFVFRQRNLPNASFVQRKIKVLFFISPFISIYK